MESSSAPVAEPFIVVSSDGRQFPMDLQMISQSSTLNKLITTFGYDKDVSKREPIPVENVKGATMEKVAEWLEHFKNDPPYVESADKNHMAKMPTSYWDRRWMKELNDQELYDLINAANFLNITRLFDAASKKVAELLTGRSFEQMAIILNCGNTPNPEDETEASDYTEPEPAWRKKVARQSARIVQHRADQASNSGF